MPEVDPALIELNISHYRALLKLRMDAETRSRIQRLLVDAARDLVRARNSSRRRTEPAN